MKTTKLNLQKEALNLKRMEIQNEIRVKEGEEVVNLEEYSQTDSFKRYAHRHTVSELEQQVRETQHYLDDMDVTFIKANDRDFRIRKVWNSILKDDNYIVEVKNGNDWKATGYAYLRKSAAINLVNRVKEGSLFI